ncbi:MAG TPA: hypothetical protein VGC65_00315 [Bacteroidia bacterium]|jgi:hypothetical protein
METIQTSKADALKLFGTTDAKGKQLLKKLFPEITFESILNKPSTWEGICKAAKLDPVKDLPFPKSKNDRQDGANAFFQWSLIREVLNAGKDADWGNPGEAKWVLWPDVVKDSAKPSGFGLSYRDCVNTDADTVAGARLSFHRKEDAKFAFDNFQTILEKLLLINKSEK